jgi:hypothetical protein
MSLTRDQREAAEHIAQRVASVVPADVTTDEFRSLLDQVDEAEARVRRDAAAAAR